MEMKRQMAVRVKELEQKYGRVPHLVVVLVGEDPGSVSYVAGKAKAADEIGIRNTTIRRPETITEAEMLALIEELNADKEVDGILVQLPLPKHIDSDKVIAAIDRGKDVDGFHPVNVGNLSIGRPGYVSCTPAGVIQLLRRSGIRIEGKECVVLGRSNIVGKPMAMLLLRENGTVTVCHSRTAALKEVTKRADILVAAIGKPKFITAEYIKEGAVVIDVGIHRMENGKLCGDVDFESVAPHTSAITPVPGGVGPMTIAMLMNNCVNGVQ